MMIYSEEGLDMIARSSYVSEKLTSKDGLKGIVTPIHPGAIMFWKKQGMIKK